MPYVAVNAKNTVYSFVFEICVHLKFGCLRGRIRLTSLGLTLRGRACQVCQDPQRVAVEHSCVIAEFLVEFGVSFGFSIFIPSILHGFPMFRTLILASTAKDKHRPDNKYLVIAHQEAAQN